MSSLELCNITRLTIFDAFATSIENKLNQRVHIQKKSQPTERNCTISAIIMIFHFGSTCCDLLTFGVNKSYFEIDCSDCFNAYLECYIHTQFWNCRVVLNRRWRVACFSGFVHTMGSIRINHHQHRCHTIT